MRRVIILVLLGILSTSMISSIISKIYPVEKRTVFLLETVDGEVEAGNFSYWHLMLTGSLQVKLTSISGDADLYVADNLRPSYEVDTYNFSSVTCGPDIVYIPEDFPRPAGIGVFGHWSHDISKYKIQIYWDRPPFLLIKELKVSVSYESLDYYYNTDDRANEIPSHHLAEESYPRLSKLLHILNIILELFIF